MLNTLEALEGEKKQLHDIIRFEGINLFPEEVKRLLSIKGFSLFTATALMADVDDLKRHEIAYVLSTLYYSSHCPGRRHTRHRLRLPERRLPFGQLQKVKM